MGLDRAVMPGGAARNGQWRGPADRPGCHLGERPSDHPAAEQVPAGMCLIMRSRKDLANKEIRFQSLSQSVQQGRAAPRWRSWARIAMRFPADTAIRGRRPLPQPWTVAALTAERSAGCSWVWPTDSRMTLSTSRRCRPSDPLPAVSVPDACRAVCRPCCSPASRPPGLAVSSQCPTPSLRSVPVDAAGSCQERRHSR